MHFFVEKRTNANIFKLFNRGTEGVIYMNSIGKSHEGNESNYWNWNGFKIFWSVKGCLLYTSPSPRDRTRSRMPSSA